MRFPSDGGLGVKVRSFPTGTMKSDRGVQCSRAESVMHWGYCGMLPEIVKGRVWGRLRKAGRQAGEPRMDADERGCGSGGGVVPAGPLALASVRKFQNPRTNAQ